MQELRGDMGQEGNEEQTGRAWEEMEEGNFIPWHWKLPVTDTKATPEAAKNWAQLKGIIRGQIDFRKSHKTQKKTVI